MKLYAGTSGFSYKEWKGPFYPEKLPQKDFLSYYAGELPAVEINNTFYRLPKAEMLEGWAEQTPDDFRFAIKASRKITHFAKLEGAEDATSFLLDNVTALGQRLGVLFFQLPPYLKKGLERLQAFLDGLPDDVPLAFEFRHQSWFDDAVYDALRDKGAALCLADTDEGPDPALVSTGPFGYLRLRRGSYDDDALASWIERIRDTGWERAFVFFKHEDEGAGPRMAKRFLELAG